MVGSIPLVRSTGMGRLPAIVEERAGERALKRMLQAEGLPLALCEPIDVPIPAHAMVFLFDRSATLLGDRTLGLQIGQQMTHAGFGRWIDHAVAEPTLRAAVERLIHTSWAHQSAAYDMTLAPERGRWVWRVISLARHPNRMQHSDHLLWPMIGLARTFLGPAWLPGWIEVDYAKDPDAHVLEQRLNAPIHFERPGVAIVLTPDELARSRSTGPAHGPGIPNLQDVRADIALSDMPEPSRSVAGLIALRLLDGKSDIDGAARLAGMGVQALQRLLRRQGYTYREILAACRRARAESLLRETDIAVSDIAVALGYEEHANFSRAFSGWAGLSPRRYRERHAEVGSGAVRGHTR